MRCYRVKKFHTEHNYVLAIPRDVHFLRSHRNVSILCIAETQPMGIGIPQMIGYQSHQCRRYSKPDCIEKHLRNLQKIQDRWDPILILFRLSRLRIFKNPKMFHNKRWTQNANSANVYRRVSIEVVKSWTNLVMKIKLKSSLILISLIQKLLQLKAIILKMLIIKGNPDNVNVVGCFCLTTLELFPHFGVVIPISVIVEIGGCDSPCVVKFEGCIPFSILGL
ncbi:hypothetical protein M9H77_27195 [Catharanthus roseus]|uniref:Uncharacterized protein n=1 Tax=Catharanthus roseus TaxID=4058 RepID=A0ACC0AD96_CATRO|nr:hypothetical protein M9H77_27195 [Catharanthus roseus]